MNARTIEAITNIVDVIIEHEGAFGMNFGDIGFEARWKCNNSRAYARRTNWTEEDGQKVLEDIRVYLMDELNVKDDEPYVL